VLSQLGYIKVDWVKVKKDYNVLKQRNPNIDLSGIPVKQLAKENLPLASGFAGGALVAIGQ